MTDKRMTTTNEEALDVRVAIQMTGSMSQAIEDYRWKARSANASHAIRDLIQRGLDAAADEPASMPGDGAKRKHR